MQHGILHLRSHLLCGLTSVTFHDSLSLAHISASCDVSGFHHNILIHHGSVHVLAELFPLVADFHLLSDDAQALSSVKSTVLDLSLEGELLDCRHVNIVHLEKNGDRLHSVLESEDGLGGGVAESAGKK